MKVLYVLCFLFGSLAFGSDYGDAWGPAVGTQIPAGEFASHGGETRSFSDLMGDRGLLILFNRSASW